MKKALTHLYLQRIQNLLSSSLRLSASRNDTLSLSMRTEKTLQITA